MKRIKFQLMQRFATYLMLYIGVRQTAKKAFALLPVCPAQELRIEGVDLAAARYHVIDQERLLSWSAAADKIENNQVLLIEAPVNL
jgi:hypothetical protein